MSISCTVKHVQHIGIIRGFCLPGGLVKIFSAWEGGGLEGDRKDSWLVICRGDQYPGLRYVGDTSRKVNHLTQNYNRVYHAYQFHQNRLTSPSDEC